MTSSFFLKLSFGVLLGAGTAALLARLSYTADAPRLRDRGGHLLVMNSACSLIWGALMLFAAIVELAPLSVGESQGYATLIGMIAAILVVPVAGLVALVTGFLLRRLRIVYLLWVLALGPILAMLVLDKLGVLAQAATPGPWSGVVPVAYGVALVGLSLFALRLGFQAEARRPRETGGV